jgi:hypothetical protein
LAEILYLFPHIERGHVMLTNFGPVGILTDVDYLQDVILATLVFEPERRHPDVEDCKNQVLTTKFRFTRGE